MKNVTGVFFNILFDNRSLSIANVLNKFLLFIFWIIRKNKKKKNDKIVSHIIDKYRRYYYVSQSTTLCVREIGEPRFRFPDYDRRYYYENNLIRVSENENNRYDKLQLLLRPSIVRHELWRLYAHKYIRI